MESTAADVWREWVRAKVLRPQDYDSDVSDHVRCALVRGGGSGSGSLVKTLEDANWTARDLLHALAPVVQSFTGMQRDLLRLLERVGATAGTKDNLRVQYEFVQGDVIDESLASFRERVRHLERVALLLRPLAFSTSHAFDSPIRDHTSFDWVNAYALTGGTTDLREWKFADGIPDPVPTGDAGVDERAERIIALVRRVLMLLASVGDDTETVRTWMYSRGEDMGQDIVLRDAIFAATDFWPLSVTSAVHGWTTGIAEGNIVAFAGTLAEIDEWIAGFDAAEPEEVTIERDVEALTDILSLPTWGVRHELYSAWICTQFDRALDSRLEFVVTDGAVRFPFHETLLARFDSVEGRLELLCEVRSPATGTLSGGRKANIQPDYRVRRPAPDHEMLAAVEVKQYKSPAASRHGGTLRDYVVNLPEATVLLVGHGPLGKNILDAVPSAERARARVYPDVRVGSPSASAAFRAEIARLFPPPRRWPTRIELRWSPAVIDLDLHVSGGQEETSFQSTLSRHSELRADAKHGGPEIVDLRQGSQEPLDVRVNVYSPGTLRDAAPIVQFYCEEEFILALRPSDEVLNGDEAWWSVARVGDDGQVEASPQSRDVGPLDGVT